MIAVLSTAYLPFKRKILKSRGAIWSPVSNTVTAGAMLHISTPPPPFPPPPLARNNVTQIAHRRVHSVSRRQGIHRGVDAPLSPMGDAQPSGVYRRGQRIAGGEERCRLLHNVVCLGRRRGVVDRTGFVFIRTSHSSRRFLAARTKTLENGTGSQLLEILRCSSPLALFCYSCAQPFLRRRVWNSHPSPPSSRSSCLPLSRGHLPPPPTGTWHHPLSGPTRRFTMMPPTPVLRFFFVLFKLYGIVQGGVYPDLRSEAVDFVNRQPFFGIAIGGSLGADKVWDRLTHLQLGMHAHRQIDAMVSVCVSVLLVGIKECTVWYLFFLVGCVGGGGGDFLQGVMECRVVVLLPYHSRTRINCTAVICGRRRQMYTLWPPPGSNLPPTHHRCFSLPALL